jgi:hypothetical protein
MAWLLSIQSSHVVVRGGGGVRLLASFQQKVPGQIFKDDMIGFSSISDIC